VLFSNAASSFLVLSLTARSSFSLNLDNFVFAISSFLLLSASVFLNFHFEIKKYTNPPANNITNPNIDKYCDFDNPNISLLEL